MTEQNAIKLAIELSEKHIYPAEMRDEREATIVQIIADIYKNGYEVVARFKPAISLGDIERMKLEGVEY